MYVINTTKSNILHMGHHSISYIIYIKWIKITFKLEESVIDDDMDDKNLSYCPGQTQKQ